MADFVSGDDDAGESAGVLDDGNAVDFLEALIDNARSSDVSETYARYYNQ